MTAPPPGPLAPTLGTAVEALALQVDRGTVLQARAVLLGEAQRLRDAIRLHGTGATVGRCGGDPVSADAAAAFTERIAKLLQVCDEYVHGLERAGGELGRVARDYGYTEDEIAASFAR